MADLLIRINGDVKGFDDALRKVQSQTEDLDQALRTTARRASIAFVAFAGAIALVSREFAKFETALVGVAKTTDATDKEMSELTESIEEMAKRIPVAGDELLRIAQIGGQLGIRGTKDLSKFTETIARLGVATELSAERAAFALTRILNVTKESITDIDKFGSVLVELGNNFAATEDQILRATNEVARSSSEFNIGATNALGFGAALASMGARAEGAGTAIGRIFRKIQDQIDQGGGALENMARLTGIAGDKLEEEFAVNATGVFKKFVKGLTGANGRVGTLQKELKKMGLQSEETLKILGPMVNNFDLLDDALKAASEEFETNTALLDESTRAFNTLASDTTLTTTSISLLAKEIGAEFAPALRAAMELLRDFLDFVREHPVLVKMAAAFLAIGAALSALVVVLALTALAFTTLIPFITVAIIETVAFTFAVGALEVAFASMAAIFLSVPFLIAVLVIEIIALADAFGILDVSINNTIAAMKGSLDGMVDAFASFSRDSSLLWTDVKDAIEALLDLDFDKFSTKIGSAMERVATIGANSAEAFRKRWNKAFKDIEDDQQKSLNAREGNIFGHLDKTGIARREHTAQQKAVEKQAADEERARLLAEFKAKQRLRSLDAEQQVVRLEILRLENQGASDEIIRIKREELAILTALEKEKTAEGRRLLMERRQLNREDLLEQQEEEAEDIAFAREQALEANIEFDELTREQQEEFVERTREFNQTQADMELEARTQVLEERQATQARANAQFLKDQIKFGTAYATINRAINSEEVQGFKQASGELVKLTQSKNSTLKSIGKAAAIAQITISTAESAMNIYRGFSAIPIIGPSLGIAGALAAIAFGAERISNVQGAAQGGIMTGGIPGTDSIPALLTPGELVTPAKNFDEVVDSVAASRLQEEDEGSGGATGGGQIEVILTMNDNLMDFIEAEIVERQVSGTSLLNEGVS